MSEPAAASDPLRRCASLIDNVCELQRAMIDDLFRNVDSCFERNLGKSLETSLEESGGAVEAAARCSRHLFDGMAQAPDRQVEGALDFWLEQLQLIGYAAQRLLGEPVEPLVRPQAGDNRFSDPVWEQSVLFDYLKQSYLLTARHALRSVDRFSGIEARERERLGYYLRQTVNALAPTNFALTNPEVLQLTVASHGDNLIDGLQMMIEDRRRSADILNICTTAPDAFRLGLDLATTAGYVVHQNELMQLIQYAPVTDTVMRTPVLLVSSWVNKYYIYDLSPQNSLVRWLLEQGHTVFCISWINPDQRMAAIRFDDYMRLGPVEACDVIERITGERQVNAIGYCLGGMLLACTAAWLEAAGERRFSTLTYLATSLDFRDPGEMGMFVDVDAVAAMERQLDRVGFLDGRLLAAGFNLLKENDLYWNYYVQNYLKGERPAPFDLMYWNSDCTNVPAATHKFVMRKLHLENSLMRPGSVMLNGRAIDLGLITAPTYVLATERDHIARWRSCYAATQLQRNSEVRFVLSGSGHIAGVINPPRNRKYHYLLNPDNPADADDWLEQTRRVEGSWWLDWDAWAKRLGGERVPARAIEQHAAELRQNAAQRAFRQRVLGEGDADGAWLVETDWAHPHVFEPGRYPAPAATRYAGRYQFAKHYFPVLADLKAGGEEFACAQLIDRHPRVRHWVRNLDTAPCGFGLPTSRGRFFADFVAELQDGRVALLEYKGAHLQSDPYEIEKRQVGELWARASGGRAVFRWLTIDGLAQQLDAALA